MSARVLKYGTGDEIPEGALYLCTKVQNPDPRNADVSIGWLVWHYFLVDEAKQQTQTVEPVTIKTTDDPRL